MTVVGIAYALNKNNERVATLHVTDSFDEYDKNTELGRSCLGQKVDTVYVGTGAVKKQPPKNKKAHNRK